MKINLIGKNFDKNSGQGIYTYSCDLYFGLKESAIDVVLNQNGDINHVMQPELIWKAIFKKNVITTVHDVMPIFMNERNFLYRIFFYISMLMTVIKSKKIICVSKCTRKDIQKYFKFYKEKNKTAYEGIDSDKFYPLKKIKNKKFTIGYIGGLGKRKNVEFILNLAGKIPMANFMIAGNGKQKKVFQYIKEQKKLENVFFVGFVPDNQINKFYNSLDLFIFPSYYEGFGLPALEAMACGILVLVSDRGSLPEIVPNEEFIINIEDINLTKKKIEFIYKNIKKRKKMSNQCLLKAKNFSRNKFINEISSIYKTL